MFEAYTHTRLAVSNIHKWMLFGIGGFWSPKIQISCLDQKVCPNLSFCKCFEAFWRAWSKLDFFSFWRSVYAWTFKHVCMYVCMYICLKPSSVYVWRPQACMFERVCLSVYVCMPQTYIHKPNIHTQLIDLLIGKLFKRLSSVYVCLKTLCLSWKMKYTHSNIHAQYTSLYVWSLRKKSNKNDKACISSTQNHST